MIHECRYALYCMYQCPSDLVVDGMDGLLRYDMVWYGMVRYYLWAEKGCLYVCVRARVHVCWAGRCCAVLVRCGAVLVRCWCGAGLGGAGFIVGV